MSEMTPREIVHELDRHIIGQADAKRAVAIALRNRWRRAQVADPLRQEITPKNILMIGPTGVGKTEISRRLAKLAGAPFIKVEATKFTEVGYVGRDVDQIIRDLLEAQPDVARQQKKLVLQPMNNQVVLRKYLAASGYRIIAEELAREGDRVYEIMVAEAGAMTFTNPLEYELGFEFYTYKHPLLIALIDRKIFLEQQIIRSTQGKTTAVATKQFQESSLFIEKLNEVKKCLSN